MSAVLTELPSYLHQHSLLDRQAAQLSRKSSAFHYRRKVGGVPGSDCKECRCDIVLPAVSDAQANPQPAGLVGLGGCVKHTCQPSRISQETPVFHSPLSISSWDHNPPVFLLNFDKISHPFFLFSLSQPVSDTVQKTLKIYSFHPDNNKAAPNQTS